MTDQVRCNLEINPLSKEIIGACIEVHRVLGPGLLESAYEECLCHELSLRGFAFENQKLLPVVYKGLELDCGYRLDVVVEGKIILELKAQESILPIHEAQLITYLRLSRIQLGLLVNFNVPILRQGLRRIVYNFDDRSASSDIINGMNRPGIIADMR